MVLFSELIPFHQPASEIDYNHEIVKTFRNISSESRRRADSHTLAHRLQEVGGKEAGGMFSPRQVDGPPGSICGKEC